MMRPLLKRHMLIFLRDRWAVFFSFLSVVIILFLFAFFLGSLHDASVPEAFRGTAEADYLVNAWLFSGVLFVSTVTIPFGFLTFMVRDVETGVLDDFFVTPAPRTRIVISYLLAAVIISTGLGIVNLLVGMIVIFLVSSYTLPVLTVFHILALVLFSSAIFSALAYVVMSFLRSMNATGTLNTLVGTLIGFLAGIYVPVGNFSSRVGSVLSLLPTLQLSSLFRQVYMADALGTLYGGASADGYRLFFGVDLEIGGTLLPAWSLYAFGAFWLAGFLVLSVVRLSRFKR